MTLDTYLEYNQSRWSEATLKSEASRLKKILPTYDRFPQDPHAFYIELRRKYKPYTLQTIVIRLVNFLKFTGLEQSPYYTFINDYANLFKNAYESEELSIDFKEAKELILGIGDRDIRDHCLGLLYTGLRISESLNIKDAKVIGKGSKVRDVLGRHDLLRPDKVTKMSIYKSLKEVGLKPHSLRKLFATELAKKDLTEVDLCKIMGWNDFKTARRYLQAKKSENLSNIIQGL